MVPPEPDRSRPTPDLVTRSSCRTGLTRYPRPRQAGATYATNGSTPPPHRPHLPPLHHRIHHHPLHCLHIQIAEILCGGVFQTRTSESLSSLRSLIITMPRGDDHLRIRAVPRRAAPAPAAAAGRGLPNAQAIGNRDGRRRRYATPSSHASSASSASPPSSSPLNTLCTSRFRRSSHVWCPPEPWTITYVSEGRAARVPHDVVRQLLLGGLERILDHRTSSKSMPPVRIDIFVDVPHPVRAAGKGVAPSRS
ncbi:hypothetical protein C8J57DRAFT_1487535 [Mycena rebaudengoi]|nr:hypothetical protein C8J57DRAFT_1487535 [Mycena rebaudengoi]